MHLLKLSSEHYKDRAKETFGGGVFESSLFEDFILQLGDLAILLVFPDQGNDRTSS